MNEFSFSDKIYENLKSQFRKYPELIKYVQNSESKVSVAVSGGADSMVLLHLLWRLSKDWKFNLCIITVNHNIKKKEESFADVVIVKEFAKKLGLDLFVKEYEPGFIEGEAKIRKKGLEEAARFFRYEAFSEFAKEINSNCLCLAHNQNDNLETLLQRFFQGGILNGGIPQKRGIYFRPLLEISRNDIEQYAVENSINFCIDSTNLENKYQRNKIRNQLIPLLESVFPGWKNGILSTNLKIEDVKNFINQNLENFSWKRDFFDEAVSFDFEKFDKLEKVIKINLLYKGLEFFYQNQKNICKTSSFPWNFMEKAEEMDFQRFPYKLLEGFVKNYKSVNSSFLEILVENQEIKIRKIKKLYIKPSFYTIIDKVGVYDLPFGQIDIKEKSKGIYCAKMLNQSFVSGDFLLPIVIRSKDDSDEIEDKNKNKKNISKIFSEWKVREDLKSFVPIFCDCKIRGIWGEPFGLENFFVKINEEL